MYLLFFTFGISVQDIVRSILRWVKFRLQVPFWWLPSCCSLSEQPFGCSWGYRLDKAISLLGRVGWISYIPLPRRSLNKWKRSTKPPRTQRSPASQAANRWSNGTGKNSRNCSRRRRRSEQMRLLLLFWQSWVLVSLLFPNSLKSLGFFQ